MLAAAAGLEVGVAVGVTYRVKAALLAWQERRRVTKRRKVDGEVRGIARLRLQNPKQLLGPTWLGVNRCFLRMTYLADEPFQVLPPKLDQSLLSQRLVSEEFCVVHGVLLARAGLLDHW